MPGILKVNGKRDLWSLSVSVLISLGVGVLSSFFTMNAGETYKNLVLPAFAPPAQVFAPVWTILYILMGIAAYRVFMYGSWKPGVKKALFYYAVQLVLNFLWSLLFFGLQLYGLAFMDILLLLLFIIITTINFYRIDRAAGLLMIPYVLWVAFAALLNYSIWILNR